MIMSSAVADCSVAALALHAGSPDAPIAEPVFEALAGRCRQAARQTTPRLRQGDASQAERCGLSAGA